MNLASEKGETSLQVASHQGHVSVVKLLIEKGAEISTRDNDGDTALHYSVYGWEMFYVSHKS